MKRYTANYAYTNPNFVIQNLIEQETDGELLPLLYVLKNILQRGFPTTLSKYLQIKIGIIHNDENFEKRFLFADSEAPIWLDTIKGDKTKNYYPAKEFFEKIIPNEFGDYAFIQSLIIPEIEINEIVGDDNRDFINQQVDFYLPQAKLVIEIDGQQHKYNEVNRVSDKIRDKYLFDKGIKTIRITTTELRNGTYSQKIEQIIEHLQQPRYDKLLAFYKDAFTKIRSNSITEEEKHTKLLPTAIIRFQVMLIELLSNNYLTLKDDWNFNIYTHENLVNFADLAIDDLFIWLKNLWKLKYKNDLSAPNYNVKIVNKKSDFIPTTKAINIDFSLFKKYTDENQINPDILYVRTDYFDIVKERNYFRVSTSEPINYNVTEEDKDILEFFLQNIFGKQNFREGQFPIIANALNRKDTIGLLPTGGGKSLCYQLPCLLQPSINFVVCPIKSLMYDQNENLVDMLITNVAFITSDLDGDTRRQVEVDFEKGRYLFVWISPEKFQIPSFRDKIRAINARFSIAYAVIDEVHCLSEWGHDFRTSYLNLARTVDKLSPKDETGEGKIKFIGLTATASVNVLKDIKVEFSRQKQKLEDENIKSLLDYSRKELQFHIIRCQEPEEEGQDKKRQILLEGLEVLKNTEDFLETNEKAGLIFTPNVNSAYGCFQIANTLNTLYPNKVKWYSGSVPKENGLPIMSEADFKKHRDSVQKDFKRNKFPLLVATKAFGMGIDKQNIYYTAHYGLPSSVEALYQEAGRAGRWDKNIPDNENKIAKCFTLYSPEMSKYEDLVDRLFQIDTTFSEMKAINGKVRWDGRDVFRQIFLFLQGQTDVDKETEIITEIVSHYFKANTTKKLFWKDVYEELHINGDILEKAIYRLSLLGIVSDWTTDFINHYEVGFKTLDERQIINNISNYINKYEPDTLVEKKIQKVNKSTFLEKSIWYLLNWTFENIAYNRKQSLKTLKDWCHDFKNSEDFKRRIDNYFKFTESTFVLQHISENPKDYEKWFEALTIVERDAFNDIKSQTYLPKIQDANERKEKFESLRDGISRFLESYGHNVGLNFLSGLVRLFLDQYQDSDGIERFENALENIIQIYTSEEQEDILNRLFEIGINLDENSKYDLCMSVTKFYPQKLEYLADYYDLAYLLNDVYEQKISKLKTINSRLYEQLAEI
ncbi:MAG: DEAD/DEAH box helicase [Candidatus Symbiothrix sp.]|jgi:ATP-dependent DNA helicase RecQ|nr:DEAD/DEAH box helicase [Candidatus Symbiothrix sp.]